MVSMNSLATDVWDLMYNHLQTGTYAITTNNIYSAFNDELIKNRGFPVVVIQPVNFKIIALDINGKIERASLIYNLEIREKTAEALKVVLDQVQTSVRNGYSVFAAAGVKKNRDNWFETIDYNSEKIGESHRIHVETIAINFRYVA